MISVFTRRTRLSSLLIGAQGRAEMQPSDMPLNNKDLRQNTPPPVSSAGATGVPVVAVSALLSLAECSDNERDHSEETSPARLP